MMKTSILGLAVSVLAMSAALAQDPIWDANTVELQSEEIAEDVFAVYASGGEEMAEKGYPLATSAGFVVGENGVLLVESMLNERLTNQLLDLVAEQTDKPVKYVVNTSYHGDHSYGNQYLPETVEIIQHANTADYVENHLEADKEFMMQNFGEGRGIEEVVHVEADILVAEDGAITINLGGKQVDIRDYGFAQTGGDLFVSVPEANVLWTGNAVPAQAPALPWLLDGHLIETRESLQAVYEDTDAETLVVPGHGPVTDRDAIKWNIDYLNAIESEVQTAIDEGLTLEETVEAVQLPDYQGYALFGWVHPSLNVPAAYNDLSQ